MLNPMPLVIYHKDCFDGMTAAWVVRKYFKERGIVELNPIFHGAKYGDIPPIVDGQDVYIVDFSYKRDVILEMYRTSKSLTILDHHKTAEADLKDLPYAVFDMKRSGAGLAWDWFFPGKPRPWLVNIIEDRDIWKFEFAETADAHGWISTVPLDFESWDELANTPLIEVCLKGSFILRYIDQYGKKAMEQSRWEMVAGHFVPTTNMPYMNCSEHLHSQLKKAAELGVPTPFVASYYRGGDGRWRFSLRSDKDGNNFDVSEIAKLFGGGGHRNAAGFDAAILPWEAK